MGNLFARLACFLGLKSEGECYCIENPDACMDWCGTEDPWYDDPDPDPPEGFSELVPLGANPDTVTVSGQDIGALMANDIMVILSAKIKGGGFIAGAPFVMNESYYDQGFETSEEIS